MTKKLENASNNLKEILYAITEGKEVQFYMDEKWWAYVCDWHVSPYSTEGLLYKWRIKPDAFEEAWAAEFQKPLYKTFDRDSFSKSHTIFKAGWNAAMEHKNE